MNFRFLSPVGAVALLALVAGCVTPPNNDLSPLQPLILDHTFNLIDFGAVADGQTANTKAFAAAIAAVNGAGGGKLIVPAGTFLTGPIALCNGLNLHLEAGATIQFSPKASDYVSAGFRRTPQMAVNGLHDVMISGAGKIDGHGEAWWPAARARRDPVTGKQFNGTTSRPPMLVFGRCQRVRVEGVTLQNSPGLNLGMNDCVDATITGITILNPADSPNTDGIDPKGCQRVLISRCHIDTGDDCIALGGSRGLIEQDILITDCAFFHGHGCSIGSGTSGGVRRVLVRRCSFDGTDTGVRLKSARGRGGMVEDVTYEDLTMVHVGRAVSINGHYEGTTVDNSGIGHVESAEVTATTPRWRHIVVRNVTARAGTADAGLILGLPEMPAEDIVLDHVSIEAPKGLMIAYTTGIALHDVHINAKEGEAYMIADTVKGLTR